MKLTCFHWTTCQHTEHLNEAGERVGITEILDEVNKPIYQQQATYPCPACEDPNGNHNGIGIRPVLQATPSLVALPSTDAQMTSSFNPQIADFQPAVTQSSDLYANQPVSNDSRIYPSQSTVPQSNNFYPSMPTGSQHAHSNFKPYSEAGLYTAAMHNARNNLDAPGFGFAQHGAPYGGFHAATTGPDHSSNAYGHASSHNHTHGHNRIHATERQGTTYFGYPEGDVEGLIISHNSLGNHNQNNHHDYAQSMVHHDHFASTEAVVPHNTFLASKNAAKAAVIKKDEHKPGKPCPDGHPQCHWHYARSCHESPVFCRAALQAITAAFHAHGAWKDAPMGWNETHEPCVRAIDPIMCVFHAQLKRRIYGSSFDQ